MNVTKTCAQGCMNKTSCSYDKTAILDDSDACKVVEATLTVDTSLLITSICNICIRSPHEGKVYR